MPTYVPLAKIARIEGTVTALVSLSAKRSVQEVSTEKAHPLLAPSIKETIQRATFRSDCGGNTVVLSFHFNLAGEPSDNPRRGGQGILTKVAPFRSKGTWQRDRGEPRRRIFCAVILDNCDADPVAWARLPLNASLGGFPIPTLVRSRPQSNRRLAASNGVERKQDGHKSVLKTGSRRSDYSDS
jgi:hypothetical protein